jgi:hypothetical protein
MTNEPSLINQLALRLNENPERVQRIIDELCIALNRDLAQYKGLNGDYLGEQLHWDIGHRAFFYFLGFLDTFSTKYNWERGIGREYALRLLTDDELESFSHEYQLSLRTQESLVPPGNV